VLRKNIPLDFDGTPLEGSNEATRTLAKLKAKAAKKTSSPRHERLPLANIRRVPALFQARTGEEDDRHVAELARAVKTAKTLEPLLVMQIGRQVYLLDGHHRWLAYEQAGICDAVPVTYFEGTVDEAVLAAGRANTRAKLPMIAQERQNFAWRLVLLGSYSKAQTAEASGVSERQVAVMRQVKKTLGAPAHDYTSWWQARREAHGRDGQMSDEDREVWKEERAADYADRIGKACGPKFRNNAEVAAMALERYFGRRLGDMLGYLRDYFPEEFTDPDE
jgi:hypothetical protein